MTRVRLLDGLDEYLSRSTSRRERLSDGAAHIIKTYTPLLEDIIVAAPNSKELVVRIFNALSHMRPSSAHTISTMIGQYLVFRGVLEKEDYKTLVGMFRVRSGTWSDKALTEEQLNSLLLYFLSRDISQYRHVRDLYIVAIMSLLGLRIGQVLIMKKENIKTSYNKIAYVTVRQKSSVVDEIEKSLFKTTPVMHNNNTVITIGDIHDQWNKLCPQSTWAFSSSHGKPLTQEHIRKLFRMASKDLGFDATPHSLRHTVGTRVATNAGIVQAAELLDHSDVRTTQRYIAVNKTDNSADIVRASIRKEVHDDRRTVD